MYDVEGLGQNYTNSFKASASCLVSALVDKEGAAMSYTGQDPPLGTRELN